MEIKVEKNKASHLIKVDGELTIYNAAGFRHAVEESLDEAPSIEFDLSGACEFDTAAFQILILAKKEAKAMGKGFKLASASPAVWTLLGMYRMKEEFTGE